MIKANNQGHLREDLRLLSQILKTEETLCCDDKSALSLADIESYDVEALTEELDLSPPVAERLVALFDFARTLSLRRRTQKPRVTSSRDVFDLVQLEMRSLDREVFYALALDARNAVIDGAAVSVGTLTGSLVQPREVFRYAIRKGAASLIICHNHPSGDPSPSLQDHEVTRRLVESGDLLGIPVLDHLIVGDGVYVSLADSGHVAGPSSSRKGKS